MSFIFYAFLAACFVNLLRIGVYLISSDVYALKQARAQKHSHHRRRYHYPTVSVVIPAYNEALTIERTLLSLYDSHYPAAKLEVLVMNDGSTDKTADIVREFRKNHKDRCKIRLINRPNKGKAAVLNYALRRCVRHSLIMCLDADSYLDKNALRNAAQHFRDRKVVGLSANVNIIEDGSLLALVQRIEYLMGYHMKKGQDVMGIDYIIGGIGSVFRKSMLKKVLYYDTNTMTEDIDLTMKIFVKKRPEQRIVYASDCIAYTEAVHSFTALFRQRFRWKYGRSQTFLKHSRLFFTREKHYSKRLTWFMMPFVLFQDFIYSFEPIIVGYFLYVAFQSGTTSVFNLAVLFFGTYVLFNIWSSDHLSPRERLRLTYYGPPMYLLIYVTGVADYYALAKAVILAPKLKASLKQRHFTWRSPERRRLKTA